MTRHFKLNMLNAPSIIGRVSHRDAPGGPAIRDVYSLSNMTKHTFLCYTNTKFNFFSIHDIFYRFDKNWKYLNMKQLKISGIDFW